jgi:hypothetical protein
MTASYGRFDGKLIERARRDPSAARDLVDCVTDGDTDNTFSEVGKAWDALQLAVSEERRNAKGLVDRPTDILGKAVLGAADLTREDAGYGPPRFLTATEVLLVAAALQTIDEETVRAAFDPNRPDLYRTCEPDELVELFESWKEFYLDAANENEGVVVVIT